MLCFPCLAEAQNTGRSIPSPAITVYMGNAMCLLHVNLARGLPAEYGATPVTGTAAATLGMLGGPTPVVPRPAPHREAAPTAAPEAEAPTESGTHEQCINCTRYTVVHYQPDLPHCACGAALIDGVCEETLDPEAMAAVLERIAPR